MLQAGNSKFACFFFFGGGGGREENITRDSFQESGLRTQREKKIFYKTCLASIRWRDHFPVPPQVLSISLLCIYSLWSLMLQVLSGHIAIRFVSVSQKKQCKAQKQGNQNKEVQTPWARKYDLRRACVWVPQTHLVSTTTRMYVKATGKS